MFINHNLKTFRFFQFTYLYNLFFFLNIINIILSAVFLIFFFSSFTQ